MEEVLAFGYLVIAEGIFLPRHNQVQAVDEYHRDSVAKRAFVARMEFRLDIPPVEEFEEAAGVVGDMRDPGEFGELRKIDDGQHNLAFIGGYRLRQQAP